MRKRTQSRECALQILYQDEVNPDADQISNDDFWDQNPNFTEEVRQFADRVVEGTRKNRDEIDQIIQKAADNWQLDRMAIIDRNILRLSVYELLYLDDIPPKVTINEAVNIAKKFSQEDSGKFVNGVLDKINHSEKPKY